MTIENGVPVGGGSIGSIGGGSGGGSSPGAYETAWNIAYTRKFSELADQDLFSDGDKVIDGKTWTVLNSAVNGVACGVGASYGGIKQTVNPATVGRVYTTGRTGFHMDSKLRQFLVGTPAEDRNDIELRITARLGYVGAFTGGVIRGLAHGLGTRTINGNYQHWIKHGYMGSALYAAHMANTPGSDSGGLYLYTSGTVPPVVIMPNVLRISLMAGGVRRYQVSDIVAADIDAATYLPSYIRQMGTNYALTPYLEEAASAAGLEFLYFFGLDEYYGGGADLTAIILEEFRVEWRLSARGDTVVYW